MAVETEKTVVLNIDAQSGIKSMKDLKQAIKDGKDQLVQLDESSEEYKQTLSQVAELQHQYREINEQVNKSTMDFGQTLSNVNSVMAGGVAAIQGVTAGLSLMGVDLGDDDKLTKNLVKSMSLLQAMSKMDAAVKGFKALSVAIKANITAAGGLGKALKALAVSNPFTAILAAATAVIGVFSMISSAAEEEAQKVKEFYENAASEAEETIGNADAMRKYYDLTEQYYLQMQAEMDRANREVKKKMDTYGGDEIWAVGKVIEELKEKRLQAIKDHEKYTQVSIEIQIAYLSKSTAAMTSALEHLQAYYAEYTDAQAKAKKDAEDAANKANEAAKKARQERETREANEYKHKLSLLKQANQLTLAEEERRYQEDLKLYENNEVKKEEITLAHQKKLLDINNAYIEQQITLMQSRLEVLNKTNKDGSKQTDIDSLNEQINELNRKIQDNTAEYEANSRAVERNRIEREIAVKQALESGASQQRIYNAMNETQEVLMQHDRNWNETLAERSNVLEVLGLGYAQYYEDQMNYERELISLEEERKQIEAEGSDIELQVQQLQERFNAQLITEAEYNEQRMELQQAYLENKQALDDNEVQTEKLKLDRKKALNQAYASAIKNITGQLTGLLNSMADAEDVSFEDSKKMKIAAATISTIQGGINAFMGYLDSGIPQPYASILGAASAAATVAMGMMEIQKIRNTKKDNASVSNSAMNSITLAQPQIVNLNAVNDEIELPDTRVYVLESDITEAQNRVHVVENNSNF